MNYIKPFAFGNKFTCPHCGTITQQDWWSCTWNKNFNFDGAINELRISKCVNCDKHTLWILDKMYYPDIGSVPFPNPEMPESVKKIYLEAASIHVKSPRGAAALLRLAIQVLCKELGEPGKHINTDISSLVAKGLPEIVQQSLDLVRVTGNNAVHPGQIDTDDIDVVGNLFELINVIVEYMIALPNKVSGLYSNLPTTIKNGIKERDSKK